VPRCSCTLLCSSSRACLDALCGAETRVDMPSSVWGCLIHELVGRVKAAPCPVGMVDAAVQWCMKHVRTRAVHARPQSDPRKVSLGMPRDECPSLQGPTTQEYRRFPTTRGECARHSGRIANTMYTHPMIETNSHAWGWSKRRLGSGGLRLVAYHCARHWQSPAVTSAGRRRAAQGGSSRRC
jgi:hypothetical protein